MQSVSMLIPVLTFCQAAQINLEEWARKSERIKIDDISKQIFQTIYYPYSLKMENDFVLEQLKKYLRRRISVRPFLLCR
ncbi:hypothetical protein ANCCAN_29365 [Ancylostoma caninum]|uniref:Uncharacterized protein n=1 Tax=Ancylostoma caninum TaxID=29170 RepID=A0A368F419_ANCCA|nr:hypothetical protein ANCCAN_29365 [Ancylostoma caninum]